MDLNNIIEWGKWLMSVIFIPLAIHHNNRMNKVEEEINTLRQENIRLDARLENLPSRDDVEKLMHSMAVVETKMEFISDTLKVNNDHLNKIIMNRFNND